MSWYQKLYELTFYIKPILSVLAYSFYFRKIKLKEVKLHKQKIVKADHVIDFINSKDQFKSQKELPERILTSECIPYGDHTRTDDHKKTKYHEDPACSPDAVKQLLISWLYLFPEVNNLIILPYLLAIANSMLL